MGTLSIVATPIGNLEDITLRALRTLKECDVIYAEDTRVVSKLLARYEIKKPLQRLDAVTETKKADDIIARLEAGEHVAYVSDAGTPGISDPGTRLVAAVRARMGMLNIPTFKVEAIPGPSALTAALSIAGLPVHAFTFLGFLPNKKGRQTLFAEIAESSRTMVFYESPHRIRKALETLAAAAPEKRVAVARELTKLHEELVRGTAAEVARAFAARPAVSQKGEFVVIVAP